MCKTESETRERANAVMRRFAAWLEDNDTGIEPCFGYSGRWMFGQTCFGLVGSLADIQCALMEFVEDNPDDGSVIRNLVKSQRRDNMGLDMIVYFPDVDIPKPDVESGQ